MGWHHAMSTPDWLRAHLESRGLWDSDGYSRATKARRCRCHEYVLAGLDSDRCALPVAVDPDPLSRLGEAVALLAERPTYSLRILSGRLELDHRNHFEIRGEVVRDNLRHDVLVRHTCGLPSLGQAPGLGQASRLGFSPVGIDPTDPNF